MNGGESIPVISCRNAIHIIRKSLSLVDSRLVKHGERVSYLVYKMMKQENCWSQRQMQDACILGLLHDIGAYKTDEIDKMVEFETGNVWHHAIYGYLFLKLLSPLNSLAESILYHHLNYEKYNQVKSDYLGIASKIKLTDRMDIMMKNGAQIQKDRIQENGGTVFSPKDVSLFFEVYERENLLEGLSSGDYLTEWLEYIDHVEFSNDEVLLYLRTLAFSIDFRSETTVLHTIMTVSITMEIAKLMELEEDGMKKIYFGALLHDLGKISTPLEILEKSGPLTREERLIMEQHVTVTKEILKEFEINEEVFFIAVRHHEKLDGSGYPDKLTAKDLTLSERIVAVADIISALIGKRSYKESFSSEIVKKILQDMSNAGKICPTVTDMVISHYDTIINNATLDGKKIEQEYKEMKVQYEVLCKIMKKIS